MRAGRRQPGGVGGVDHELGKGRRAGPSVTETALAVLPRPPLPASQAGLGKSKRTLKRLWGQAEGKEEHESDLVSPLSTYKEVSLMWPSVLSGRVPEFGAGWPKPEGCKIQGLT